jgi:hypothetical protein
VGSRSWHCWVSWKTRTRAESAGGGPDPKQAHAASAAEKIFLKPARKRVLSEFLCVSFQISASRACKVLKMSEL